MRITTRDRWRAQRSIFSARKLHRKRERSANADVPPLPLAGEGWGEGTLVEAFPRLALTLPSPASGRGEKPDGQAALGFFGASVDSGFCPAAFSFAFIAASFVA